MKWQDGNLERTSCFPFDLDRNLGLLNSYSNLAVLAGLTQNLNPNPSMDG